IGIMGRGKRTLKYVFALLLVLMLLVVIAASVGAARISLKDTGLIILSFIPGLNHFVNSGYIEHQDFIIISQIRLPRIFLSIFVGIALASAGVIFQGIFRNPMADPYIIGVSAGASFGATIGLLIVSGVSFLRLS